MWFCIFSCKQFEGTFENTQWRKVKQMQPMWLFIFSCKQFEGTFENTQWRKVKQMQPVWLCILCPKCFEGAFENAKTFNNDVKQCNQCDWSDYSVDASSSTNQLRIHLNCWSSTVTLSTEESHLFHLLRFPARCVFKYARSSHFFNPIECGGLET